MPKPTVIAEELKMEAIPEAKITEHPEVTEVKPGGIYPFLSEIEHGCVNWFIH